MAFQAASWNKKLIQPTTPKSKQISILPYQRTTSGDVVSLPIKGEFRVFKVKILLRHWIKLLSEVPKSASDFTWGQFACSQKLIRWTTPRWHTLQVSTGWLNYSSEFASGEGCWTQPTEAFALPRGQAATVQTFPILSCWQALATTWQKCPGGQGGSSVSMTIHSLATML